MIASAVPFAQIKKTHFKYLRINFHASQFSRMRFIVTRFVSLVDRAQKNLMTADALDNKL